MTKKGSKLPQYKAAAFFHENSSHQDLMAALAYQFINLELLKKALVHPSIHPMQNNQRLEFLGDAVLQLVISQELLEQFKDTEGKLTFKRQKLVNEAALAGIARHIKLGNCLYASPSFVQDKGLEQDSVLADAMEALLAAIYLDGGLDAVRAVILRLWGDSIQAAKPSLDAKGQLQAVLQAAGPVDITYVDLAQDGPPHQRSFTVAVLHEGKALAQGTGKTKRAAQQEAAQKALETLQKPEDRL